MALPKWTEERTQSLVDFIGSESPISQATVANAAEELETSTRSVSMTPATSSQGGGDILRFQKTLAGVE